MMKKRMSLQLRSPLVNVSSSNTGGTCLGRVLMQAKLADLVLGGHGAVLKVVWLV